MPNFKELLIYQENCDNRTSTFMHFFNDVLNQVTKFSKTNELTIYLSSFSIHKIRKII